MEQIKLTINGKEVLATPGKTILEVVHENKLDKIPTLCHDDRIEPYGSCFLCVVEVEGMGRLVASCCTPIAPNMVIHTDNERIRSSRKTSLELLLSNHYADCIGPCINNCPANVDAQGYIALIAKGKHEEALKLIKEQNPLPLSIGRVCVRDCEVACRRQIIDKPVAINHLKRYVADIDLQHLWKPEVKESNGKTVAIVGGGPAGLTCAYYLTLEGYKCTILEKLPRLGGMLMYGIPEYRLPKDVLDAEIQWILDLGVDVKTGVEMGKDFNTKSLFEEGYDAVFVGVGAHKASNMRLEHENDTEGIMWGIDFLRELPHRIPELKGTVIVVGGGNTAIDAARTALRCGADKVKIVYRRGLKEMPAHEEEVHAAQEENIEINFLTNPKSIIRDENNRLKGIECLKMELVEGKPGERPRPVPVEGSEFEIPCDFLIGAIGQAVDSSFADKDEDLELERWGNVLADSDTMETSIKGVFAGGDAVTGPLTAISSIAQGKIAALSIDEYLRTGKVEKGPKRFLSFKHNFADVAEYELEHFKKIDREKMPELPNAERNNFNEVELGYTDDQAKCEPKRCIECGCSEYYDCELRLRADDFNVDISELYGETRKYIPDTRHPFIVMDPNKCINCGRCVRTCSEILDVSALGFVHRGFRAIVKPAMEKELLETNCIACGNCVDTCPTGALTEKFPFKVMGTLPKENQKTICNFCSIGCNINFKVVDEDVYFVSNSVDEIKDSHNRGYLCVKGRFGYRYLAEPRALKPMVKKDGVMAEVSWDQALDATAKKLKEIIDQHGPEAVALFGSPKMSNEALYLLQKFARTGLKTNNIGSFSNVLYGNELDGLDTAIGVTTSTTTMDDIQDADVIVVINGDLSDEYLVMEMKIKQAMKKGAKLALVNSAEINLTKSSDLWLDTRKGSNTVLLNGLMRELVEKKAIADGLENVDGFGDLKKMVAGFTPANVIDRTDIAEEKYQQFVSLLEDIKKKVVFIYNIDAPREKSKHDMQAITNFLMLTGRLEKDGNGIIIAREYSNSTGLMDMGVAPNYLPGYVKSFEKDEIQRIGKEWKTDLADIFKPVDLEKKLMNGEIKALLLFGEDPLVFNDNRKYFKGVEFVAVHDLFLTDSSDEADVVFPAATFLEQDGTYTACDRRVQGAKAMIPSKGGKDDWQVIQALAEKFDKSFAFNSTEEIYKEIQSVNRFYTEIDLNEGKPAGNPLKKGCFNESGKPRFTVYEVDLTTLSPEQPELLFSEHYFKNKIKASLMR